VTLGSGQDPVQFLVAPSGVSIEDAMKELALLIRRLADREDAGLPEDEIFTALQDIQRRYRTFSTPSEAAASAGPGETVIPYPPEALWHALDTEWQQRGTTTALRPN
jgi:hypothetical protein